ncbi:MAG TPA: hypothetical protein DCE41_10585 [Cytophagales bacterium]|nr:hypothetical protein [Cytophagales bacterium]HAA21659.1 hypothetical protein [Cytophagales bacterium]HAP63720.1 hypothetical protein [Cytophagales bacterium]
MYSNQPLKAYRLILLLFIAPYLSFSQSIPKTLLSTAGGQTQSANGASVSWSLGELSVSTNASLHQGYQHPQELWDIITDLREDCACEISAFPNPTRQYLKVQSSDTLPLDRLRLIDMQGRIVLEKTPQNPKDVSLDLASIPMGPYLLIVTSNNHVQRFKVIKDE